MTKNKESLNLIKFNYKDKKQAKQNMTKNYLQPKLKLITDRDQKQFVSNSIKRN